MEIKNSSDYLKDIIIILEIIILSCIRYYDFSKIKEQSMPHNKLRKPYQKCNIIQMDACWRILRTSKTKARE